ncbi:2,3-epoxybenzoyl-CoA dihydrolase [Sporichthya sp.]|uniref:2,3-epoxybenzoyl-CoA dihydrolase n=1 Tax=Sporichthya sp. TaxID=65475 RepID=UPI001858B169|nr:2,3-epoxybenzoyl-CoA dihydrolase [Sporichthya sp.]MBA3745041.1 benzoyl-CoA-dihydrodiol lyase [Sporichthya sp.]
MSDTATPPPVVSFDASPDSYRHLALKFDGPIATIELRTAEDGGLVPGYELKLNSYDLGVDIELHDAIQRLRFEHPEVRTVVVTGGLDKVFCAGANIRMLAQSGHPWKVNFCKFTNETRNGIEDATENSGQTYIAAVNGTAAGGGYELALACEEILLIDDGSSAVSLPEVPLLAVLPGTGGLTRVVDKRKVRKDRADVFATKSEGFRGQTAVDWKLVDASIPRSRFAEAVHERALELAERSHRPADARGIALTPLHREVTADGLEYQHVSVKIDRDAGQVDITVRGPVDAPPADVAAIHAQGADFYPMAVSRELDDAILRLRTNELEAGTWVIRAGGDAAKVLAYSDLVRANGDDWYVNEIGQFYKRVLKRLDVTSRSLIALVEPGSCFAGPLLELLLACDRQYMLDGTFTDAEDADSQTAPTLIVTEVNFGAFPMSNGLTRLQSRFYGDDEALAAVGAEKGNLIDASAAEELGLITYALDDIDWEDDVRIALEERASMSPDALTGMEANHRFVGPETMESKIFARLTAWQNWIFIRPNAVGPEGALRKYGTGQKAVFDRKRV